MNTEKSYILHLNFLKKIIEIRLTCDISHYKGCHIT